MLVADFDFDLPEKLIAQEPAARRDASRLLVVRRQSGTLTDAVFHQLPEFLQDDDLLVVNNTRVFPARLIGKRLRAGAGGEETAGAKVEVFLIREQEPLVWEALVKPGRSMLAGARVEFEKGALSAEVIEWREYGRRLIRFTTNGDFNTLIDRLGRTPLPPYIRRSEKPEAGDGDETERRLDTERYQTVYAKRRGAIAAPTAGLHFTPEVFTALRARGIEKSELTLHVGYGTFQPVKVERVEDHRVEPEFYSISEDAAHQINTAVESGRRVIAVGTTTTRALESAARLPRSRSSTHSPVHAVEYEATDLFIHPGFEFRILQGLVTNFHLPKSSLLMLVSAFAGRELILEAYRHAVQEGYRFYSYGDAMLIV